MSRTTAAERARRILAIVPWVAERDGPTIQEISTRFGVSETELLADLDVVFMVGTPPYTPDSLIDVVIEDGRVWITLGHYFRRPMRLVPSEALGLLAAGRAALATRPGDADGPLARALDKLAASLGPLDDEQVGVDLGAVSEPVMAAVRQGVAEHRRLRLDYYSYGKDEHSTREVDGTRVYARDGNWYLLGWCHLAEGERVFRLDRIAAVTVLDEHFEPPENVPDELGFQPGPDAPRVTLSVTPEGAWIVDYFPHERAEVAADGSATVTLAVTALPWLARLLLRLGPDARIDAIDTDRPEVAAEISGLRSEAAGRILARYRSPSATS